MFNSTLNFLKANGIQKPEIIQLSKEMNSRFVKEKPVLEAFWKWLDQQKPLKDTHLDKVVNYAQNRKDALMTYLEDGHCSLSNNLSLYTGYFYPHLLPKIA